MPDYYQKLVSPSFEDTNDPVALRQMILCQNKTIMEQHDTIELQEKELKLFRKDFPKVVYMAEVG